MTTTVDPRTVSCRLELTASTPAELLLQVSVADTGRLVGEKLAVTSGGTDLSPVEIALPGQGRVHRVRVPAGPALVTYTAAVAGHAPEPLVSAVDEVLYVRPSRYVESDRLVAFATAEFAGIDGNAELLAAVSSWVGQQLAYLPGSSRPTDGAVSTMLQRSGVCRDFAHLVVALLRARNVPARLAAVYAPGLDPMDFHAVAEAAVDGVWRAADATLLAPRSSLVRIASGRDAADTAFLSVVGGVVSLDSTQIIAAVDGSLPSDDITELVSVT